MQTSPIYVIEYILGACLAGYIFNYILGRVSNGTLAQRWFDAAESFLVSFFCTRSNGNGNIVEIFLRFFSKLNLQWLVMPAKQP